MSQAETPQGDYRSILVFDPGGTTGVAKYIWDTNSSIRDIETFSLGPGPHHDELWNCLNNNLPDIIVYERFQYQRRELDKGVSLVLDSVEYIGILKLFAKYIPPTYQPLPASIHEQTPSMAKNLWTDAKLHQLSLWRSSPHERDAVRHLLYYLTVTLRDQRWIRALHT